MIRNLLYLFKRFKTAVVLNLFGLTIAFAAFLLIVMQVDYEMNYDAMAEDVFDVIHSLSIHEVKSRRIRA